MARIGIITGVRREADCLAGLGLDDGVVEIRVAGADPQRAGELATEAVAAGAKALLSFGLCGALDPDLEAAAIVLPTRIIAAEAKGLRCDPDWTQRLADALGDMVTKRDVTLAHSAVIVPGPRRKAVLRANTGADVVDMESYAVGQVAKRANVPFAVIRAVSDTAATRLPEWTDEIVSSSGGTDGVRLLKNLVTHPGDLGKLIKLGRGSTRALKRLRAAGQRLAPGFALDEGGAD